MRKTEAILSFSIVLLASCTAFTPTSEDFPLDNKPRIVVAVIDSGIKDSLKDANFVCKTGNKDFTNTGLNDSHGHGTHISGLIDQYAKDIVFGENHSTIKSLLNKKIDYCQLILKYWDPIADDQNLEREIAALRYAITMKVDIINFSSGGDFYSVEEHEVIKEALDAGIKIVVAAGNGKSGEKGHDISVSEKHYYPACDDTRLTIVGNTDEHGNVAFTSNFGSVVNAWEIGTQRLSLSTPKLAIYMTGTSQATAVRTGKIVHEMLSHP